MGMCDIGLYRVLSVDMCDIGLYRVMSVNICDIFSVFQKALRGGVIIFAIFVIV